MTDRPKAPAFPRFPFPPPVHGTPEWEERMRKKVAYVEECCAFYRTERKRPAAIRPRKPRLW
jgi:hypothetical protein